MENLNIQKDSGNWFDGLHEPIISKELFDAVQEQILFIYPQRRSESLSERC